jgi:hypothetical protein
MDQIPFIFAISEAAFAVSEALFCGTAGALALATLGLLFPGLAVGFSALACEGLFSTILLVLLPGFCAIDSPAIRMNTISKERTAHFLLNY